MKQWGRTVVATGAVLAAGLMAAVVGAEPARATVPTATPTTSVIDVKVGGDRSGTHSVAGLAGVELGLFATVGSTDPINGTWAHCVSDADGDCSFVVPDTGPDGGNRDRRPVVRQLHVPAGWYTNPALRTGLGDGSGSQATAYEFTAPALVGGQTYVSTSDFMFTDANVRAASVGTWQQSRVNPTLAPGCGLSVALLFDLSSSVASSLPDLKQAADTLTDALAGTPSRMAAFSMSTDSPSAGADANHPDLLPVTTTAQAAAFKQQYAHWDTSPGTNWDQGFFQVAQAVPHYQVLVVLADGNPTRYSADPVLGDDVNTHFSDVESGVFSANALKAEGTRVLVFGVGHGATGVTRLNFAAVSGPVEYDGTNADTADYFQTDTYADAGQALRNLALARCDGTVTVVKQILPYGPTGEDITGAEPAGAGWRFTAATTTPGVTVPASRTTTADGTGSVAFGLSYPDGTDTAAVTIHEIQQTEYSIVTRGGFSATCVNLDDDTPVTVTNTGTAASPGFTVAVPRTAAVSCTVYNREGGGVAQPPTLPATGVADALPLGSTGLVLLGTGAGLLIAVRRRRPRWSTRG